MLSQRRYSCWSRPPEPLDLLLRRLLLLQLHLLLSLLLPTPLDLLPPLHLLLPQLVRHISPAQSDPSPASHTILAISTHALHLSSTAMHVFSVCFVDLISPSITRTASSRFIFL
jgi:hypothetical protein